MIIISYHLNFEYNDSQIKFFIYNDYSSININEYINYIGWKEKELKHLNLKVEETINKLIAKVKSEIPTLKIDSYDKVNTICKAVAVISNIVKNNNKFERIEKELKMNIKDWYLKTYPTDSLGKDLNDNTTFKQLDEILNNGSCGIYSFLGKYSDTVIRERCFQKLSEILEQNYDVIYNKWLGLKDYDLEEIEM